MVRVCVCRLKMPDEINVIIEARVDAVGYLAAKMDSDVLKLMYPIQSVSSGKDTPFLV